MRKIKELMAAGKEFAVEGDEIAKIVVGSVQSTANSIIPAPSIAALSPDGNRFVAALDNASVWDSETGQKITDLFGFSGRIHTVAFSHDGRMVAASGDDRIVRVWDANSGAAIHAYEGHSQTVRSLLFVEKQQLASASADGTIRLWDFKPNWRSLISVADRILPRQSLTPAELRRAFLSPQ